MNTSIGFLSTLLLYILLDQISCFRISCPSSLCVQILPGILDLDVINYSAHLFYSYTTYRLKLCPEVFLHPSKLNNSQYNLYSVDLKSNKTNKQN